MPTIRTNLESPRPRHASRTVGYTSRSSPLAGPAIAVSSPSLDDDTQRAEETGKTVDSEKTRTGATPSRISTLYPTPPSSLRSISLSRTPSPTRSEFSLQSSTSSAFSTPPSPVTLPSTPPAARTRNRSRSQLHQPLPHHERPPASVFTPAPFEYPASAAPFTPHSSPDAARNWLTKTAPPPFSRARAKGVVMPVKASARRPKTAPAATGARNLVHQAASTLPQGGLEYRMAPISLNEGPHEYRNLSPVHSSRDSLRPGISAAQRKPRRPRSSVSISSRPTLGEVREEHECEGEGDGDGESSKEGTAQNDGQFVRETLPVIFPVLAMKDGRGDTPATAHQEKGNGWIRRWKNSLKRFKDSF